MKHKAFGKILSLCMAAMLVLGVMPVTAFAADNIEVYGDGGAGGAAGGLGAVAGADGGRGGDGGRGADGASTSATSDASAIGSITVIAGDGGDGGDRGHEGGSGRGGNGGRGGHGGHAELTLTALEVNCSGEILIQGGSGYGGGYGGDAILLCDGALTVSDDITITNRDGGIRVNIGTLKVIENITLTVDRVLSADDVTLGTVNVAAGKILTIASPNNGKLTINNLNIEPNGSVNGAVEAVSPAVALMASTLSDATVNTPYSHSIAGYASGVPPFTFTLDTSSELPEGLDLNGAGVISGTPTAAVAARSFYVTVTDALDRTATANYTLTVGAAQVNTPPEINGQTGNSTDTITLTEGYAQYTKAYTIMGNPAPSVTVTETGGTGALFDDTTGLLTIPTGLNARSYTIKFTATNSVSPDATMTVTVNVDAAPITGAVATPTASPPGGTYTAAQSVSLSCATPGATIYYTLDGGNPDNNSSEYTAPITVDSDTTIKAIAYAPGMTESAVMTESYHISTVPPPSGLEPYVFVSDPMTLDLNATKAKTINISLGSSGIRADIASDNPAVADVSPASTTSRSTNVTVTGKAVGSAVVTVTFYDANGEMNVPDNSFAVNVINSYSPPSYSGDSGSGSGGSGSGTQDTVRTVTAPQPVTLAQAKAVYDAALQAAKESGGDTVNLTLRGDYSEIPLDILQALAGWAKRDGMAIRLTVDVTKDSSVTARYILDPSAVDRAVSLLASADNPSAINTAARFRRWFANNLAAVSTGQTDGYGMPVDIAVKVDLADMDAENLCFYSYDSKTNQYRRIEKPAYWIDKNG